MPTPLLQALGLLLLGSCYVTGDPNDLVCVTEGLYDVRAEVTVGGVSSVSEVVHPFWKSRDWVAGMNASGCKYKGRGDLLLVPTAQGGVLVVTVPFCARAQRALDEGETSVDLLELCRKPTVWAVDSATHPTRWRELHDDDDVTFDRVIAEPSRAWRTRDELESVAPALLRATFLHVQKKGDPGFGVFAPQQAVDSARDRAQPGPALTVSYGDFPL